MDTNLVEFVLMHGPCLKDPSQIVEREVAKCDIQAWKRAGYQMGGNPYKEFAIQGVTYSDEDALAQVAATESAPVKRGRKPKER